MSYSTWIVNGYGVCVDDITTTPERILKLAKIKPALYEDVCKYLKELDGEDSTLEDLTVNDFDDYENLGNIYRRGIAGILQEAMCEEIEVVYADDYGCISYVLFCPCYPWQLKEQEKILTEEDVRKIFEKYVSILTDESVNVDYYRVENGG